MKKDINRLENLKKDDISYFCEYKWLSHWENYIFSDYWKDWKRKINEAKDERELDFYSHRLSGLLDFICKKYRTVSSRMLRILVEQEEKRLEEISEEDFKKENNFVIIASRTRVTELGSREILNMLNKDKRIGTKNFNKNKDINSSELIYFLIFIIGFFLLFLYLISLTKIKKKWYLHP